MSSYPFRNKKTTNSQNEAIYYLLRLTNGQYAHPLKRQCQPVTLKSPEYEGKTMVRQGYGKEATSGEVLLEGTIGVILNHMRENKLTPSSLESASEKENFVPGSSKLIPQIFFSYFFWKFTFKILIFKELSKKHVADDENDTSSLSSSEEEEQRKPTKRKNKQPISKFFNYFNIILISIGFTLKLFYFFFSS